MWMRWPRRSMSSSRIPSGRLDWARPDGWSRSPGSRPNPLLGDTRGSTETPLLSAPPRKALRLAQLALTAIVLWYAGRALASEWSDVRPLVATLEPNWLLIIAASALVLATYGLLMEVWRAMLRAWRDTIPVIDAARIWFVSNLGKYIPGKVWQIGAMGVMAQRRGVSPVAAVGSSVVINLVNILTGVALVLVTGAPVLGASGADPVVARWTAIVMLAVGTIALVLAPVLLPRLTAVAARLLRREITLPTLPPIAI